MRLCPGRREFLPLLKCSLVGRRRCPGRRGLRPLLRFSLVAESSGVRWRLSIDTQVAAICLFLRCAPSTRWWPSRDDRWCASVAALVAANCLRCSDACLGPKPWYPLVAERWCPGHRDLLLLPRRPSGARFASVAQVPAWCSLVPERWLVRRSLLPLLRCPGGRALVFANARALVSRSSRIASVAEMLAWWQSIVA